ncbi:MAG TPA: tRNA lysidine(34) synthetase TilS [Vicinamibacterales bacterium]
MTHLAARVLATVRRRHLWEPGARVIAAVSGGADSVALVHLLRELAAGGHVQLVGLAHLNHALRGEEAERDAAFCAQLARDCALPLDVETIEVARLASAEGRSVEDAAREARYAFLERARVRLGGELIAVAQTRDDQAETVVLRLVRGSGPGGLAAIAPRRGHVVRPLIDLRRADLVKYLMDRGISWVEDSSNRDPRFARTRVRHELLPWLAAHVNPAIVDVLARTADIAADEHRLLTELTEAARARVQDARGTLDREALLAEPRALQRRILRAAAAPVLGREPRMGQVDAALDWAAQGRSRRFRLSDLVLERLEGRIRIARADTAAPAPEGWRHVVPVPGAADVPEAGLRFAARPADTAVAARPETLGPWGVAVPASALGPEVVVRAWERGDRLRPLGAPGRKKVHDLFVDRRVRPEDRGRVPVVAAPDGRIVWVAGHALAQEFAVSPATKSVVVLSFEPLGGLE